MRLAFAIGIAEPEFGLLAREPQEIRRLPQRPVEPGRRHFQPVEIDVLDREQPRQLAADPRAILDAHALRLVDEDADVPALGRLSQSTSSYPIGGSVRSSSSPRFIAMQRVAPKKWAAPSPFLLLIHTHISRKHGRFEGDRRRGRGVAGPGVPRRVSRQAGPRRDDCGASSYHRMHLAQRSIAVPESVNTAPRELPAIASGSPSGGASSSARPRILRGSPRSFLGRAGARRALRHRCAPPALDGGRSALRVVLGRTLGIDAADVAPPPGRARSSRARRRHGARRFQRLAYPRRRAGGGCPRSRRERRASASTSSTATARSAPTGSHGSSSRQGTGNACGPAEGSRTAAVSALLDVQGSDEQGDRRRSHRALRQLDVDLANPPRLRAGPPPYLPGDWSLHFADVPAAWLATVAIWRTSP